MSGMSASISYPRSEQVGGDIKDRENDLGKIARGVEVRLGQ
jgi:hypothetical protein